MTPDLEVWPKLVLLADALCQEIADSGLEEPCFCGIMPGAGIALDYVDGCEAGGMAWVRMVTAFPSQTFPEPDVDINGCDQAMAFQAEVGIIRAFRVPDNGEPPTQGDMLTAAEVQMAEMAAMRRAILCRFTGTVALGQYTPIGPDGGALGGAWSLSVACND